MASRPRQGRGQRRPGRARPHLQQHRYALLSSGSVGRPTSLPLLAQASTRVLADAAGSCLRGRVDVGRQLQGRPGLPPAGSRAEPRAGRHAGRGDRTSEHGHLPGAVRRRRRVAQGPSLRSRAHGPSALTAVGRPGYTATTRPLSTCSSSSAWPRSTDCGCDRTLELPCLSVTRSKPVGWSAAGMACGGASRKRNSEPTSNWATPTASKRMNGRRPSRTMSGC